MSGHGSGSRRPRSAGLRLISALAAGSTAASTASLAYAALNRRPPGGTKTWSRTNHRGEPVTLLEGPAVAAGAIAGVLAQAGVRAISGSARPRADAAAVLAAVGAAAFGAYDDLAGSADRRGFRGHLGALRHGEVTTGAVKLGGIGATGLLAAAVAGGPAADVVLNAGLIAGGANLLNLLDRLPRPARIALLAGIAGLTAASEKVSFTKVIERTPALRRLDMAGRRPANQVPVVPVPAQRRTAMRLTGAGTNGRSAENSGIAPPDE